MDEATELVIPYAHRETACEAARRLEARAFWEKVDRQVSDDAAAEAEREREAAEFDRLLVGADVDAVADLIEWRRQHRADAESMWARLGGLGCVLYVARGRLQIEPAPLVPAGVMAECMALPLREQLEALCDERDECGGDGGDVSPLQGTKV